MDLQLTNETALVTGSTAGIGLAITESLAVEGASVILNGRTEERVKTAIQHFRRQLPRAWRPATSPAQTDAAHDVHLGYVHPIVICVLGKNRLYLDRIGNKHTSRDGPLRSDYDGPVGGSSMVGGDHRRNRRHVNSVLPGPTESEGVASFVEQAAKSEDVDRRKSRNNSFRERVLLRYSNVSLAPLKWPLS